MIHFLTYDTSTGEIKTTGTCQSDLLDAQPVDVGVSVMEGIADFNTQYVSSGIITNKPKFTLSSSWNTTSITADGISSAIFGPSLPNGTLVTLTVPTEVGTVNPFTETSGSLTINTTIPGTYIVKLQLFPYQVLETTLTAVPIGSVGADYYQSIMVGFVPKNISYADFGSFTQTGY